MALTRDDNILIGRLLVICTDRNRSLLERFSLAYEVIDSADVEFCLELGAAIRKELAGCELRGGWRARHLWDLETINRALDMRLAELAGLTK